MTTLAAVQGNGWCVIGADSRATDDSGFVMHVVTGKIFTNGPALIAGAGAVRGINLLQFGWKAPAITTKSTDIYMTKTFIPSMRETFIANGYEMKDSGDVATNDNDFIVAVKGVLYLVADDYSFERCSGNLYCAGSGGKYALGALSSLGAHKAKSVSEATGQLQKAIAVAIKYDAYSGGLVSVFSQEA